MKKIVESGERNCIVTLDGTECEVVFSSAYRVFEMKNDGSGDVVASVHQGRTAADDGVRIIHSGEIGALNHMTDTNTLYLTGSGTVHIAAGNSNVPSFKMDGKGGVKIDDTLSVSGQAADSKAVGDKLKILQDVVNGVTHRFVTDNTTAYSKAVPVGAKIASVNRIGGRTVCFNQMQAMPTIDNTTNGSQHSDVVIDSVINGKITVTDNGDNSNGWGLIKIGGTTSGIVGHKYYCRATFTIEQTGGQKLFYAFGDTKSSTSNIVNADLNVTAIPQTASLIGTCNKSADIWGFLQFKMGGGITFSVENMMCFDLTKMFGAGNEPATAEEFEAMFPEEYCPYDEGTLMASPVTAFNSVLDGKILDAKQIPSAVLALEGYGDGINDSVYNYIDFETMTYHKCVGRDIETLSVYELSEPVVTDITDMLPADFNILDVMTRGNIVFEKENKIPVPSEVEYIVSLAEVMAND